MAAYIKQNPYMLAENLVLYLQNTHFVLLFNILCIEFHETFCEASLSYSQHAGSKKTSIFFVVEGGKVTLMQGLGVMQGPVHDCNYVLNTKVYM